MSNPPQLRDPIEIAEWLEALSANEGHARNHKGARALWSAAKLLRAGNEQDDTQPQIFVCPNCSFIFGVEPE